MVGVDEKAQWLIQRAEIIVEKAQEKLRNRSRERELRRDIEREYKLMMRGNNMHTGLIKFIEENQLEDLNLEFFIKPGGICEAIAASITFKPTQLRKLFHELRRLQHEEFSKIRLLKLVPFIAYAKGRDLIDEDFYSFVKTFIQKIEDRQAFKIFIDIFEAIVAYHRYYNPKES